MISTQKIQLEDKLLDTGWKIIKRDLNPIEWWAVEIWIIESVWTPVGFNLYLTFMVDLLWDCNGDKSQHVDSIEVSKMKANDYFEAGAELSFYLKRNWEKKNLPSLIKGLSDIRTKETK